MILVSIPMFLGPRNRIVTFRSFRQTGLPKFFHISSALIDSRTCFWCLYICFWGEKSNGNILTSVRQTGLPYSTTRVAKIYTFSHIFGSNRLRYMLLVSIQMFWGEPSNCNIFTVSRVARSMPTHPRR